jgi:AraC-like DNA-binding protein
MSELYQSDYSTPGYVVQAALRGAMSQGLDPKELLKKSGIDPQILENPNDRIESSQFAILLRNLWLIMKDEYLGFGPAPSLPGTFATMCQCILPCHNLLHAIKRGVRFYSLFEGSPTITVEVIEGGGANIKLDIGSLQDPDHFLTLCTLVLLHRFTSWGIGSRIPLIKAVFQFDAPINADDFQQFLATECDFNASFTGFVIPAKMLQAPLIQNEVSLKEFLINSPLDLVSKPVDLASYSGQVRRVIGRDFSDSTPGLEEVADTLHLTPQTLRRRLKDEGASFQEIKDNLRRDLSIHYLNTSEYSVQEIAELLGFAETSNFHRAFKKWTGSTPRKYRI